MAVLLNITPDHLDRYKSFEAYRASKLRLVDMQSGKRLSFVGDSQLYRDLVAEGRSTNPVNIEEDITERNPVLAGPHNYQNTMAARLVCIELDMMPQAIDGGVASYPGLPHRMERVGEHNGVLFVNDSKGTNTAATGSSAGRVREHPLDTSAVRPKSRGLASARRNWVTSTPLTLSARPDRFSRICWRVACRSRAARRWIAL